MTGTQRVHGDEPRTREATDRGSLTLVMVAVVMVAAIVASMVAAAAGVAARQAKVSAAADAAALAAADALARGLGSGAACRSAAEFAAANATELESCTSSGLDVAVVVTARVSVWGEHVLRGRARATVDL